MRKNPGVAAVVVLSIALGVSVNAAVYSWIELIVLNPLPAIPESDRLVTFVTRTQSGEMTPTSYLDFKSYKEQAESFAGFTAFQERPLSLGLDDGMERVWSMMVTGGFFDVMGIQPALGRFFQPEDQLDNTGAHPVAVISHAFWQSHFDGEGSVIGESLSLNRQPFTIIGVAPQGFHGTIVGLSFDVWVPLLLQNQLLGGDTGWLEYRQWRSLHALARLGPGYEVARAQSELDLIGAKLAEEFPDANKGISAAVLPISESPYGAQSLLGQMLDLLLLAAGAVLLIVTANLASLLLARSVSREREIGIRLALGAGQGRILRQLMTETLVFSLASAAVSLVFLLGLSDLLKYFVPPTSLPIWLTPRLSPEVILLSLLLSVVTGLAAGFFPAWRSVKIELISALREGGRGNSAGRSKKRLQGALVIAEVALALVALLGAGLLVKSLRNVTGIDPGFDNEQVLLVAMAPSAPDQDLADMKAYYRRVEDEVEALPFVRAASYAEHVPLGFKGGSWEELRIDGYTPREDESMQVHRNLVDDDYFDVMAIDLMEGRAFNETDDEESPPAAIVNETFVRRYLNGQYPIGHKVGGWGRTLEIVGVVKDSKYESFTESPRPYLYVPFRQFTAGGTEVIVHVAVDKVAPASVVAEVRGKISVESADAYVLYAMPIDEYTGAALFRFKISAILLGALSAVALILAALGIYGVMSHTVTQRKPEVGVRMVLGATRKEILAMIASQGLRLSFAGLAVGVLAAAALSRFWTSLVYGVGALDPGTVVSVALIVILVSLAASFVPALRASRVDPARAIPMA